MTWAWGLKLPPAPKFVLMALADEANDDGYCFPAQRRLATKCSIDARSVRRMIGVLAAEGYVVVKKRFRNRARTSNGYQLVIDTPGQFVRGGTGGAVPGDGTPQSGGSGRPRPGPPDNTVRVTTTDPLFDPKPPPQPRRHACADADDPVLWEALGGGDLCFPEGISSAQRRALAGHVFALKFEDAQMILDELAGRMAHEKVHNPIRYFSALIDRLKQGKFVPELGIRIAERRAADRLREQVLRARWTAQEGTPDASNRVIPPNAQAVLDRLRGRPVAAQPELDSDDAQADAPSANDDAI